MKKNRLVAPALKWVGGKRQLISDIEPLIPKKISTYVEPFIGGGAILFHLQPKKAIINDYNQELMNVYKVIKDDPDALIEVLKRHKELHSEDYFYEVRSLDRQTKRSPLGLLFSFLLISDHIVYHDYHIGKSYCMRFLFLL